MKSRYLSLLIILTLILAMFAVTGIALAQDPQGDDSSAVTSQPSEEATEVPTEVPTVAPTEEATVEPTVAPTEEATVEPTVAPTEEATVEPTVEVTVEPTVEVTVEPTVEVTVEPTVTPTVTLPVIDSFVATPSTLTDTTALTATLNWAVTGADTLDLNGEDVTGLTEKLVNVTATTTYTLKATNAGGSVEAQVVVVVSPVVVETAGEIEAQAAMPGSSTTSIIGVANIDSSAATIGLTLYPYPSGSSFSVGGSPTVPVGGVHFYRSSDLTTDGQFGGVIQSDVKVAAAAVLQNTTAHAADAYPGLSDTTLATELYGMLILNKHTGSGGAVFQSTLVCQNAGSSAAHVTAALYQKGESSPRVTVSTADSGQSGDYGGTMLDPGQVVKWAIADMARVQTAWPGGKGQIGYVKFSSTQNIACVIQNERLLTGGYIMSQYQAVPASEAATSMVAPNIYNGHGSSSANTRITKWNSSVTFVNPSSSTAAVQATFATEAGYSYTCTASISGNTMLDWYAPEIGTGTGGGTGWTCAAGTLPWSYPSNYTFGVMNVTVTSGPGVLAIVTSNKYDSKGVGVVGVSGLAVSPGLATEHAVCPVAWNLGSGTSTWVTGIQVVNLGGSTTNFTVKMVRADADPTNASNYKDFSYTNVASGASKNTYFPEVSALTSFEGAVFVTADAGSKIVAGSSSTNYGSSVNGAAYYRCINY